MVCVVGDLNFWNGHTWTMQLLCWKCCLLMLTIPQQLMHLWIAKFLSVLHCPCVMEELTHFLEPKSRGSWSSVPKVLPFHAEGPFLLERDSSFMGQTSFSPAETWLPMDNSGLVAGDQDPFSVLLLCWPAAILSLSSSWNGAVRRFYISLVIDFSSFLPGPHQWVLTLLLGHQFSSHSTQAAADLLQNDFYSTAINFSPHHGLWDSCTGAERARAIPGLFQDWPLPAATSEGVNQVMVTCLSPHMDLVECFSLQSGREINFSFRYVVV